MNAWRCHPASSLRESTMPDLTVFLKRSELEASSYPLRQAARVSWRTVAAPAALMISMLMVACGPADDGRTAGQKLDSAIAKTEQKSGELADDAKQAADKAAQTIARTTKDIGITSEINAGLARDETLSALSINVDTSDGHVLLKGNAPTAQARERAETIAKAVDGVSRVDNQLQIKTVN
ncbi:MAG: BON domain-containing protein [Rubrivivax sp.]